jgi:hypothetical protein
VTAKEEKKVNLEEQMNGARNTMNKFSVKIEEELDSDSPQVLKKVNSPLIQRHKFLESMRKEAKQTNMHSMKDSLFNSTRTLLILITWGNFLLYPLYVCNQSVAEYYTTNCIFYNSIGSVKCRLCAHVINLCQHDLADFIYNVWVSLFKNLISLVHNPF